MPASNLLLNRGYCCLDSYILINVFFNFRTAMETYQADNVVLVRLEEFPIHLPAQLALYTVVVTTVRDITAAIATGVTALPGTAELPKAVVPTLGLIAFLLFVLTNEDIEIFCSLILNVINVLSLIKAFLLCCCAISNNCDDQDGPQKYIFNNNACSCNNGDERFNPCIIFTKNYG
jgi:hypothetical protein